MSFIFFYSSGIFTEQGNCEFLHCLMLCLVLGNMREKVRGKEIEDKKK